jgi:hypothetical protein
MASIGVTEIMVFIIPIVGSYYLAYRMGKTKGKLEEKERQEERSERKQA